MRKEQGWALGTVRQRLVLSFLFYTYDRLQATFLMTPDPFLLDHNSLSSGILWVITCMCPACKVMQSIAWPQWVLYTNINNLLGATENCTQKLASDCHGLTPNKAITSQHLWGKSYAGQERIIGTQQYKEGNWITGGFFFSFRMYKCCKWIVY